MVSTCIKINEKAYDIEGRIFVEPDGYTYTCTESHIYINFPYIPKKEYVKVDEKGDVLDEKK